MRARYWLVALTIPLTSAFACRHSEYISGFQLTGLEVQLLVIFAILLVFLVINTSAYFNIREKVEAISSERKLRLVSMYQLQKFTRMQALLPIHFLHRYYEDQILPFNAEKQEKKNGREVRYMLHRRKN